MKKRVFAFAAAAIMALSVCTVAAASDVKQVASASPSKITVEIFDRGNVGGTDPTDNYYTDWIKEKVLADLNIEVEFVAISRWEETDQLNNLMAAGTAPDVCFTYSGELVTNYGLQGGLVDMTPYVDEFLPDLKEFLGPDLALPGRDMIMRRQDTDTLEMYSVHARRMNVAQVGTFIRKDWLDALDLGIPQTRDEFVDALRAFKENDPGNVGADKIIPFTMTNDVRWRASTLLESFVDPTISDEDRWVNSVADRQFLLPGYKEGFRLLNQMYNEGLIDPEFALYTDDTASDNLIKSGVVGAFIHNWDQPYRDTPGLLRDLLVNVPDAEIIAIDPFVNSEGKTMKGLYDAAGLNIIIPSFSKNIEGALQYINWMAIFENRNYLQIGDEGVTHELVDGVPKLITVEGEKIMNSPQNIDYTFVINGLDLGSDELNALAVPNAYTWPAEMIVDAYNNSMKDGRPAIIVPVTIESAGPVNEVLVDKGETLMAQSVTAAPDMFDRIWDAGIEDWLNSGAATVIAERAEKYIPPTE
jgi:putative aldouronate transport system substrate-binding protein